MRSAFNVVIIIDPARSDTARSDTARPDSRLGPTRLSTELALVFHNNYYYHYCVHCGGCLLSAPSVLSMTTLLPITRRCDRKTREQTRIYVATKAVHACMYVFNTVHSCTQWHTTLCIVYDRGAVAIALARSLRCCLFTQLSRQCLSLSWVSDAIL